MYIGSIKITKREAITSFVIIFILLFIGFFISNTIADKVADSNAAYYTAVKINEDPTQFEYGMRTNIGNALVYGELSAVDAVSMENILNDYLYIEKVYERYTMHTRTVTHTDSKGRTYTTVETYYTWDYCGNEEETASKVNFLGQEFSSNKFNLGWSSTLSLNEKTVSKDLLKIADGSYCYPDGTWASTGDIRYHYNVIPKTNKGSIFVRLADGDINSIEGKKISLLKGTPSEIIQEKQDSEDTPVIVFWVFWGILIIVTVALYVAQENNWLEPIRKKKYRRY